jgi:hypothetical protein
MDTSVRVVGPQQIATQGKAIYERLRAELEARHLGRFVAIEVESAEYFVGATLTEADAKARAQYPDRVFYVVRVGRPAVYTYR